MATKSGTWRNWLSDLLIATGCLVLLLGALFWTRTALAAGQVNDERYLPSPLQPPLPLPALYQEGESVRLGLSPVSESPEGAAPGSTGAAPGDQPALIAPSASPALAASPQPPAGPTQTMPTEAAPTATAPEAALLPTDAPAPFIPSAAAPTAIPPTETPLPTPSPTPVPTEGIPAYSPVVRIVIPSLDIERAVVPVGLQPTSGGGMEWDTDRIFATQNRKDLVGQLVGSYSPGQGGNIQLIGHNYNDVSYGWAGVFVNIKDLQPGAQIILHTEDGRQSVYQVVKVKQVPWSSKSDTELEKHHKFLGPSESERLTLITCGGANIWPFPARVYVVAEPVQ